MSIREPVESWYRALAEMNLELFVAVHAEDCVYNISGHTPISGRVRGMKSLMEQVVPLVFGPLDMERSRFAKTWNIVCADDRRVVGMMEADGMGKNGRPYDQRYVHIFEVEGDKIIRVWEFFDTALANDVLFSDPNLQIEGLERGAFDLE